MNYWKAKTIVSEYVCPVQMIAQLLNELSAPDIFNAKREDVHELKELCDIVSEVCQASKTVQIQNLRRYLIRT